MHVTGSESFSVTGIRTEHVVIASCFTAVLRPSLLVTEEAQRNENVAHFVTGFCYPILWVNHCFVSGSSS
jgi:hypothetical protein